MFPAPFLTAFTKRMRGRASRKQKTKSAAPPTWFASCGRCGRRAPPRTTVYIAKCVRLKNAKAFFFFFLCTWLTLFRLKGVVNIERGGAAVLWGIVSAAAGRRTDQVTAGGAAEREGWAARVGRFSGRFPVADLSQSLPVPCLPALFIYPRLFLSG